MATRRTIRPISPPAEVPSILTVAGSSGPLDAAFQDDAVGWFDGVRFYDTARLPVGSRRYSNCDWEYQVLPSGAGAAGTPDAPYPTELPDPYFPPLVDFFPWEIHAVAGCDTITPGVDYDELVTLAVTQGVAREVSRELWTGYYTGGHSLMRDAVELTGGTAAPLTEAMGLIEEAVQGAGVWHVPAVLEPALMEQSLVRPNGLVPLGPGSWPISFGPSYPRNWGLQSSPWRRSVILPPHEPGAAGQPAVNAGVALAAGDTFIVGHAGRVEVAWRVVDVQAPAQGGNGLTIHDLHTNAAEAVARVAAIFRYNPSLVFAARVTAT